MNKRGTIEQAPQEQVTDFEDLDLDTVEWKRNKRVRKKIIHNATFKAVKCGDKTAYLGGKKEFEKGNPEQCTKIRFSLEIDFSKIEIDIWLVVFALVFAFGGIGMSYE